MKFIKIVLAVLVAAVGLYGCDKADELPNYITGNDIALATSTESISITAADISNDAVSLSWNDPAFATESANRKYVVELDSTMAFASPKAYTQMTDTTLGITGQDLNNLVLSWGGDLGAATNVYARVKGSYANNNDLKISNVITLAVTPTAIPFSFTNTGNGPFAPTIATKDDVATLLEWAAPAVSGATFTYNLQYDTAGNNFASAQTIALDTVTSKGLTYGNLNTYALSSGIARNVAGSIDVRIQAVLDGTGQVMNSEKITLGVTPVEMTLFLYMAGGYQGWNPGAAPKLASTDGVNYDGYVWVADGGGDEFKFTSAPNWDNTNYGGSGNKLDAAGGNLKWPATGKHYRVQVNMGDMTWSTTEITTWGVIGNGTPGGWDASTPLTYNATTNKWTATVAFTDGEFKFRANNGWDINLGGDQAQMTYGGNNIGVGAGSKTVSLDLSNPPFYTYTLQ